jgi:serine/threonine protein kinase
VRPDGTVKVLDFGLAKLVDAPAVTGGLPPLSLSPTITSPAMMTGVGVLLGTAAYMSPEQARGKAVDKRSDICTFGCVFYEMLTSKRAFEGEDVSDTLAFVFTEEPDRNPVTWGAILSLRQSSSDRQRRAVALNAVLPSNAMPSSVVQLKHFPETAHTRGLPH